MAAHSKSDRVALFGDFGESGGDALGSAGLGQGGVLRSLVATHPSCEMHDKLTIHLLQEANNHQSTLNSPKRAEDRTYRYAPRVTTY